MACERVEAHVHDFDVSEEAEPLGNATCELVVEEQNLPEPGAHVAKAGGDGAGEVVVGQRDHGSRGGPEVHGDLPSEPVVVEENRIQFLDKQPVRDLAGEAVEPEVKVEEAWDEEGDGGEASGKLIVTEIQLYEVLELPEGNRDGA